MSRLNLILLCTIVLCLDLRGQVLVTVVGGGSDEGQPAVFAKLANPIDVTVDAAGNVFVADLNHHRILKIDRATQIITTVAGTGRQGFSGDGGPAVAAEMDSPASLALDASENLYVAERGSRRVRRIDAATKIITTVAGTGAFASSGDGGPATAAAMLSVQWVALDASGNLYIADSFDSRIRRVDAATQVITTYAGNGTGGFSGDGGPATLARFTFPLGLALDNAGNLFIADFENNRIRKVEAASGLITTVAGAGAAGYSGDGGPAVNATLSQPVAVSLDGSGNLYIADGGNSVIRRVEASTGIITTIAGNGNPGFSGDNGPANAAAIRPIGVDLDSAGNLFIADFANSRIRRVDAVTNIITTIAGRGLGDRLPARDATLLSPQSLTFDQAGNLFFADSANHRIRRVDAVTNLVSTVAGGGLALSGEGIPATGAEVFLPQDVAVDNAGNVYIAEPRNFRIRKVDAATGIITLVAGGGLGADGGPARDARVVSPRSVAVDAAGNLYIAETGTHRIRRVDAATGIITTLAGNGTAGFSGDGGPAIAAVLNAPFDLALDSAGNLYIADTSNQRVRKITAATQSITTVAGNGQEGFTGDFGPATSAALNAPAGVALDSSNNLYIADRDNNRIRRVDAATQIITTIAGGGTGDLSSTLSAPAGIAIHPDGTLYIADSNNNRIVAVVPPRRRATRR